MLFADKQEFNKRLMKTNNKNQILISILVPIYGVEKFIEKNARSLFEQTLNSNIEFIFVDDSSPDNSVDILKKVIKDYSFRNSQIKIVYNKHNVGIRKTREIAIDLAEGLYIYWIDGDDWLEDENALKDLLELALSTNADIIEADFKIINQHEETYVSISRNYKDKTKLIQNIIEKKSNITLWNKLIRRSLYSEKGLIVNDKINNGEDYTTLPKLFFYSKKYAKLNRATYNYNQLNSNAFSSNRKNWANLDSMIYANRDLYVFFNIHCKYLLKFIDTMYLETKVYHLLYSEDTNELNATRNKFNLCKYKYIPLMRFKYQLILFLNVLRCNSIILFIGKYFRR